MSARQLEQLDDQLHTAVAALEEVLADPSAEGLARLGDDGDLIVSLLPAEHLPEQVQTLADLSAVRLPRVQLPSLLRSAG